MDFLRFLSPFVLIGLLSPAGRAVEVTVTPQQPRLGDTLVVTIQAEPGETVTEPLQVSWAEKLYPVFPLAAGRWQVLLPTTPLETPGKRLLRVEGGTTPRNLAVWVANRAYPVQRIWLGTSTSSLEPTDFELQRVKAFKALVSPERLWQLPFRVPNTGPMTTGFGVRRYYNGEFAQDYYHRGVDYGGGQGSPVMAPAAGRVALVGRVSEGFRLHGNTVGLDHGQGVTSIFLHLSRIGVQEGQTVTAGQVIGAVGATGVATGPHLHWGLYVHTLSVDPMPWLRGFSAGRFPLSFAEALLQLSNPGLKGSQ